MADDLSKAFSEAYKDLQKTGVAGARTRSELRKAIPKDEAQMKQQHEARRAWVEDIMGENFEELQKKAEEAKENHQDIEKQLEEHIMEEYLKGLR